MIKTYLDAGVLIAAARGKAPIALRALEILDDPNRQFVSSVFLKLEVLPKAIYYKNTSEVEFYEAVFDSVAYWADSFETIIEQAYKEAFGVGLAALDALHTAAAISAGADELVTTERKTRPIHRTQSIKVVSILEEEAD
jgi:predicted nucleic acid-binding protein